MKTKSTPVKPAACAALLLGLAPALLAENSMNKRDHDGASTGAANQSQYRSYDEKTSGASAQASRGRQASDLLGQDVYGTGGESLGEIKDFAVDTQSGKIGYVVVSSGGILGINQTLRAVPVGSLRASGDRMTLDVDQTRWSEAPTITKDQLASLGQGEQTNRIDEFYGKNASGFGSGTGSGSYALVSDLRGKEVRSGDQNVGEIEEIIVQLDSRSASAVLDANDDFVGSDREYLVPINKLSDFGQDKLRTTLTRDDFTRAGETVAAGGALNQLGNTLQVWGENAEDALERGAERVADTSRAIGNRAENMARDATDTETASARPPVEAVRRAVQAEIPGSGQDVNVVAEKNKLVLRGTVPSEDLKERIEDRAESAAQGWDVESEIRVASAR